MMVENEIEVIEYGFNIVPICFFSSVKCTLKTKLIIFMIFFMLK